MSVICSLIQKYMFCQLEFKRIAKRLKNLEINRIDQKHGSLEEVTVACVQREIKLVRSIEEYIERTNILVQEAVNRGSRIIVFPEYNFFDLLGLIPGFIQIDSYLTKLAIEKKSHGSNSFTESSSLKAFYKLLEAIAVPVEMTILQIFSYLAESYRIYIYTGSYMIKTKDGLCNVGTLISKDGKVMGTQKKIHLTDLETTLGLAKGKELYSFDLDFGRVACPICMDATYFETFLIAQNHGSEIVILPIANNEEYWPYKALRGVWARVQEAHVFGLKASLNGWLAGMHFTGKAGVFAPVAITNKQDGVVSIAEHFEGNYLVTAKLDLAELRRERARAEYFGDINEEFERLYVVKTYGKI